MITKQDDLGAGALSRREPAGRRAGELVPAIQPKSWARELAKGDHALSESHPGWYVDKVAVAGLNGGLWREVPPTGYDRLHLRAR